MTARLSAGLLLLVLATTAAAAPPTLKEARDLWLHGSYGQAQDAYETLLKDDKARPAAALGLSRTLESQGEYDRALDAVDAALKDLPKDAALQARRAGLLHLRGRWDEADRAVAAALAADPDSLAAHWVRAQLARDRGDLKAAEADCKWIVKTYSEREAADKGITDPDELLIVGQAGVENARGKKALADQFEFILNEVYGFAVETDKSYWPAEVQAGLLLLEKYNRPEALDAFDKALKINPSAAEAHVGKGVSALARYEFKDAEDLAERALKINPSLPDALRLRADVDFAAGEVDAALKELATARKIAPRDERTLARIAACYFLQRKEDERQKVLAEVKGFDSKPAVFHYEYGQRLEERRRYDEAKEAFLAAEELRPLMPGPKISLGSLYMRLGDEKQAAVELDAAFDADPFNVRVKNQRTVLEHLKKYYATLKTDHFELRYDPRNDAMLARYMAVQLEEIYDELSKKFQYQPKGPILVEVFNNHEMFSGRVVALPDLHTIGACTGKMVAMVSPNGAGIRKPFNWSRVLRHELVHIFNLEQTHYLVPHWLTEGLAVSNEGFPRPPAWDQLLLERVPSGELLDLDTIDLGFIRPRSPLEWQLAYCQALLYVQYIEKTYGKKAPGELLEAYREGLDTAAALRQACKVEKAAFEKGYRGYLDGVVKGLAGKPPAKRRSFEELKAAWEKDPTDYEAGGALAEAYLPRDKARAREIAEAVKSKKDNQPLANLVLARLARQGGDPQRERQLLEAGFNRADPDPKVAQALGKLYYDGMDFARAVEVFEAGRKAQPYEPAWLERLAAVYAQTGDKDKLIAVLKELVPTDADDFDRRVRLAKLLLAAGKPDQAEVYARQALEINIRDAEARELLLKCLTDQKKDDAAAKLRKVFEG